MEQFSATQVVLLLNKVRDAGSPFTVHHSPTIHHKSLIFDKSGRTKSYRCISFNYFLTEYIW